MDEDEIRKIEEYERTRPLTLDDFESDGATQLAVDAINVQEKRVELSTFPADYQQKIRNFYRFASVNVGSVNGSITGGRSTWK